MPLARYALYAQGEQIHVAPTAFDDEMGVVNARNTAFEGGVFVVSVCIVLRKASYPSDFEFEQELAAAGEFTNDGGSCIVAPDGRVLAGPLWKQEGHSLCRPRPQRDAACGSAPRYGRPLRPTRSPRIAIQHGGSDAGLGRAAGRPIGCRVQTVCCLAGAAHPAICSMEPAAETPEAKDQSSNVELAITTMTSSGRTPGALVRCSTRRP